MNTKYISIMTVALLLAGACVETCSAQTGLSVGAKYYQKHSVFTELPYDDGDTSAFLSLDSSSEDSLFQLAVEYAWDVNGIETTDYVITPQINIIWKDGPWFGGVGALASYIEDTVAGDDWTDVYWQLILGVKIPFIGSAVNVGAHYAFESWSDLSDFDTDDLAYGAWLNINL